MKMHRLIPRLTTPSPRRKWTNWATNYSLILRILQIRYDFVLFPKVKVTSGQKFEEKEEVITATETYFEDLHKTYFSSVST